MNVEEYLRRKRIKDSKKTADRYRSPVNDFVDFANDTGVEDIEDVDADLIDKWLLSYRERGYADKSIQVAFAAVRDFIDDDLPVKEINPAEYIEVKDYLREDKLTSTQKGEATAEDIHFLEKDEVSLLIDNVPTPTLKNTIIIKILVQTGIRQDELCKIRISDIDQTESRIKIRNSKTSGSRKVWYNPDLNPLLNRYINVEREAYIHSESPYLITSNQGTQAYSNSINRMIVKAADNAGLQDTYAYTQDGRERNTVSGHVLRHTYAVHAVREGMDIRTLQQVLNHSKLDDTAVYLQFKDSEIRDSMMTNRPDF